MERAIAQSAKEEQTSLQIMEQILLSGNRSDPRQRRTDPNLVIWRVCIFALREPDTTRCGIPEEWEETITIIHQLKGGNEPTRQWYLRILKEHTMVSADFERKFDKTRESRLREFLNIMINGFRNCQKQIVPLPMYKDLLQMT
jgi:hypothetical protein